MEINSLSNKKPAKPYPDFPLFAHNNGQWCKKIRGKLHYFGTWSEADAAVKLYLKQRDHLYAGEASQDDGITVSDLCEQFYEWKSSLTTIGELKTVTLKDYNIVCTQLVDEDEGRTHSQKHRLSHKTRQSTVLNRAALHPQPPLLR